MSYNLVIVESAAKSKTIEKYLESIPELSDRGAFKVIASLGHVRDLPSKSMGVDTTTWDVTYENITKKRDIISRLKAAAKDAKMVYLASDPDREGTAIAHHLKHMLGLKKGKYVRVAFNEITKRGIRDAFMNPGEIDMAEVDAQESRRILDRVVGYELSPLLWRRFATSSLSAGRVQSTALKLVVQRARDVASHEPEMYWVCEGSFKTSGASSIELSGKAFYNGKTCEWQSDQQMREWMERIATARTSPKNWLAEFSQKTVRKNPAPPFITSTLQQEAYQRYHIPAKRTMQLAQNLYEAGHITYMRTDSTLLSNDAQSAMLNWIGNQFGEDAVVARQYATKNEHAQEAHECIRPTNVHIIGEHLTGDWITPSHQKLYELIRKRAIASQMSAAEYAQVNYDIFTTKWKREDVMFHGSTNVLVKAGYLALYQASDDDENNKPEVLTKWRTFLDNAAPVPASLHELHANGDVTRPPPLYHEPTLVKVLEKEGIGRPSTYATILDKLQDKGYVTQGSSPLQQIATKNMCWAAQQANEINVKDASIAIGGKEKDRLVPTSLGERVVDYLENVTPFLMDVTFTAEMENDLDMICKKAKQKNDVLSAFYEKFHGAVGAASDVCKENQSEKGKAKDKSQLQPSKILGTYTKANIVQTRYGPALFLETEKRFVSLGPFMEWRSKSLSDITEQDVEFLTSLPISIPGTSRTIAYGPYGLYIKDEKIGNIPMIDKALWDAVYDHTLVASDIDNITKNEVKYVSKRKYPIKKKVAKASS